MSARAISAASRFEAAAQGRPSRWAAALLEPIDGAWLAAFRALLGLVVAREMGWATPPALRVPLERQRALAGRVRVDETGAVRRA